MARGVEERLEEVGLCSLLKRLSKHLKRSYTVMESKSLVVAVRGNNCKR